jgi:ribose transport system substrate-binding protein
LQPVTPASLASAGDARQLGLESLAVSPNRDVGAPLAPYTASVSKLRRGAALTAAACAVVVGSAWTAGTGAGASGSSRSDAALQSAITATNRAFKGTNRPVDDRPRAAVKGKHLVVVSAGQESISAQVPADAAVDAAEAIGWDVDLYDGKLIPATWPQLVRQAVAAGADAILLVAIDCQTVKQPLEEARAKGVAITGVGAFDCSDPKAGNSKRNLFNARINLGAAAKDVGEWVASYGVDQANYIIAASKDKAKVLLIAAPEFTTINYIDEGFRRTIPKTGGSRIVSTLEITSADIVNNQLVPKIQAELLRHPEVNWIRSPFTYVTTLGVVPALGTGNSDIDVMGGEGFLPELDLVRDGKITAVNVASTPWVSWAAIDTLNSLFRHEKPADSGFGWVMADRRHNLPSSGALEPSIDYKAAYRKVWGVTQ